MKKNESINFEDLFHTYYLSLINYACKFVLDKSIAEDILQEVFISMWINRENIDFKTRNIEPYLYKAIRNRSINYIQSEKDSVSLNHEDVDSLIRKEMLSYNSHDALSFKDLEQEIQNSVENLPPQCKKVFIYSRYHHLKNKEIALMLGIHEKTVEKHITKALAEIRLHLIEKNLLSLLFLFFINPK